MDGLSGRLGAPHGRLPFARYVLGVWLPNHRMEATTRQGYTVIVRKYLLGELGGLAMNEILPSHVRGLLRRLEQAGASVFTLARCKTVLGSIFTTAVNDQVIYAHSCAGVTTPPVVAQPLRILTPAELEAIVAALPGEQWRLLAEVTVEAGLRWGELAELRLGDVDLATGVLTVARSVAEVRPGTGHSGRFVVKPYPKDRQFRRLQLSTGLTRRIAAHAAGRRLGPGDLLFSVPSQRPAPPLPRRPAPAVLGVTAPNAAGRCYRHGTLTGYSMGGCRCADCRAAYASYRAQRRAAGKDQPRPGRTLDTDGHLPRDWFRHQIWLPALRTAGITCRVRFHDLRHAHASWALAGGADLQAVRQRLGHAGLRATERYLHILPGADTRALAAYHRTRATARRPRTTRGPVTGSTVTSRSNEHLGGSHRRPHGCDLHQRGGRYWD